MNEATLAVAGDVAVRSDGAPPRLGFLGVGWIGRSRMQALAESGAGTVTAVADTAADRARQACALVPGARAAASLDELLAMDLDGIVIATPSALHAEQAQQALEAGRAVFCQKPLARTRAENRQVIDAARSADRLLGVDLSYRYTEAMRHVREVVRAGAIGDVYAVELVFHNAYGPDAGWARDPSLSGGGCVMDLGIHLVDLALWVLDYPAIAQVRSQLFAEGRRLEPGSGECEDHALATMELANGPTLRLACSWGARTGRDAVIDVTFSGSTAAARMRNMNGSFYDFVAELFEGTSSRMLAVPPDDWGGRALIDWSARLGRGERYDPGIETMIDVAGVLDAVLGR
jgi:predicted dehydrogenase